MTHSHSVQPPGLSAPFLPAGRVNWDMDKPKTRNAPRWLYAIAIVGILFVLAIAILIRFAPKVLIFW